MRYFGAIALVLILSLSSVHAQTLSEVETKYGAPINSYSVSKNVWMSPEFTDDGQICKARLYPRKIDPTNNYLGSTLSLAEVKEILDELVPVAVRGNKKEDVGFLIIGNIVFSGFGYENVRINFVGPLSSGTAANRRHVVAEFAGVHSAEIVSITWLKRKCVTS
jgi:hypothetical protein